MGDKVKSAARRYFEPTPEELDREERETASQRHGVEPAAYSDLLTAAKRVTRAYTAEAEDWNDGEFALWRKDDLVVALVELRELVGDE